jgi:uncharacterized protein CbrC (UPF0167 family)
MENLPVFKYHPDPIGSGSVVESKVKCKCCGKARGYIYSGPVYAEDELDESICPWCIADGSAHEMYDASFLDCEGIPGEVPAEAMEEIEYRTPGFSTWQSERWLTCCGEAAAFLEPVGIQEIRQRYPQLEGDLMGYIVHEMQISGGAARRMLESLQKDAGPTAYVFQCLKCAGHKTFIDGIFDVEE